MPKPTGGPAYPLSVPAECEPNIGMTMRQAYKAAALQGYMAGYIGKTTIDPKTDEWIAQRCAGLADAMIKEDEEAAK